MRVIVTLISDGIKETGLEGDTDVFDDQPGYEDGHKRLTALGFWLSDWRYCQTDARPHKKSKVFVPWGSCLYVETKEREHELLASMERE